MKYCCFASRTLSARMPAVATVVAVIAIFASSVFSQTSAQSTADNTLQQPFEKGAGSDFRGHHFARSERPDAIRDQGLPITISEVEVRKPIYGSEDNITSSETAILPSGPTRAPGAVHSDTAGDKEKANFKKSELEDAFDDSWAPFDALPRPNRFREPQKNNSDDPATMPSDRFHWKDAILQSMMIQGVQHAYALVAQEKTRRALKGPFFRDYWNSVKALKGWDDGNRFFTNYIAHPMQGAMTGFIFLQNHDRMKRQKFGESKQYWKDRFKAFVWSTAWSTNWELGPISQSSIGNVGLKGGMGYVDLVMTPTAGTGWMVVEEALDRYVVRHMESKNLLIKIFARTLLNPMRSVANVLRFREPWYRDRPFGH